MSSRLYDSPILYRLALFLVILGLLIGGMHTNRSYAWFTDSNEQRFAVKAGKVHFEMTVTPEAEDGKLVPGKNLVQAMKLVNRSSIDTNLRVQISYTVWSRDLASGNTTSASAWYVGPPGSEAFQKNALKTSLVYSEKEFVWKDYGNGAGALGEQGWWEYQTTLPAVQAEGVSSAGIEIPVFGEPFQLCYDGEHTTRVYYGKKVEVAVTVQAKQSDYVTWEDIGTVQFYGTY